MNEEWYKKGVFVKIYDITDDTMNTIVKNSTTMITGVVTWSYKKNISNILLIDIFMTS